MLRTAGRRRLEVGKTIWRSGERQAWTAQYLLRQAGHPPPAEPWPNHLHFIIQTCFRKGGTWGETAQQKQLLSLSTVLDQSPWHTSSLCDTGNEEESLPAARRKKNILKIKGFDAYPEETCFSIFTVFMSMYVKDGKYQG